MLQPCSSRGYLLTMLALFSGSIILSGCAGKRQEHIETGAQYNPLTLGPIPTGTDEERLLAEYKRVYKECANPQKLLAASTLTLAQQVRLSGDYSNAQQAFDEWLHFVTDTITTQSSLEPGPRAAPEFRYDLKAVLSRQLSSLIQTYMSFCAKSRARAAHSQAQFTPMSSMTSARGWLRGFPI